MPDNSKRIFGEDAVKGWPIRTQQDSQEQALVSALAAPDIDADYLTIVIGTSSGTVKKVPTSFPNVFIAFSSTVATETIENDNIESRNHFVRLQCPE